MSASPPISLAAGLRQVATRMQPALDRLTAQLERTRKQDERSSRDASYKLPEKPFPWSCTVEEGLIMAYVIEQNDLRAGFEIATAFGFSSFFLAQGLKANGGALVSLDCYVEESAESYFYSTEELQSHLVKLRESVKTGTLPSGLSHARAFAAEAGLEAQVDFQIGASPGDVPACVGDRQIDFALIDGGHFGDQPTVDFRSLQPFLAERCAILFHDNNQNEAVERAVLAASAALGEPPVVLDTYYSLTLVSRKLDPECVRALKAFRRPSRPLWKRVLGPIRRRLQDLI